VAEVATRQAQSLSTRLGCSEDEALALINQFMERNPAVKKFMDEALSETEQTGYAFTVLGRRRFLPEIVSMAKHERARAARQAGNLPIQGSAADCAKMAMILIDEARLDERFGCKMLLQVHDELLFECPEETADEAMEEIRMWMEHSFPTDALVRTADLQRIRPP
jgi:DNA polymerase-1